MRHGRESIEVFRDYLHSVSSGEVYGKQSWSKIGAQPASDTAERNMWNVAAAYVFPSAAMGMEVVSSDNTNDKAGGTGALEVTIYYLDTTFTEKTEVIVLTGTVEVPTVAKDIYRVNYFRVSKAGSTGVSAGAISLRHLSDSPIYSQIPVGQTRAKNFIYTVPKDKVLYINNISFSAGANASNKRVTFHTKATYNNLERKITPGVFTEYSEVTLVDSTMSMDLQIPSRFMTGTDLKITVAGEAGAYCTCMARGWLEAA